MPRRACFCRNCKRRTQWAKCSPPRMRRTSKWNYAPRLQSVFPDNIKTNGEGGTRTHAPVKAGNFRDCSASLLQSSPQTRSPNLFKPSEICPREESNLQPTASHAVTSTSRATRTKSHTTYKQEPAQGNERTRTSNHRLMRPALCRLSYIPIFKTRTFNALLPSPDSNQDQKFQRLRCCHCTTGQNQTFSTSSILTSEPQTTIYEPRTWKREESNPQSSLCKSAAVPFSYAPVPYTTPTTS